MERDLRGDLHDLEGKVAALQLVNRILIDLVLNGEAEKARRMRATLEDFRGRSADFTRSRSRKSAESFVGVIDEAIGEALIKGGL